MRTILIAGALIALVAADGAAAQAVHQGAGYPAPGARPAPPPPPVAQQGPRRDMANRWGGKIGGHWSGGADAPGGWQAYRRPARGLALPHYWVSPRFYIDDWARYHLAPPPAGHNWARYYDDAVLIDDRGSVYDSVDGIDWDGYSAADDDDEDDRRGPPPPHHGPHRYHDRGGTWVSPDGLTTVTTTNGYIEGALHYAGGYGGTTTVTVETAPQITTTTTETYEDRVTYSRPHKKVWRKKIWRPKSKLRCACGS